MAESEMMPASPSIRDCIFCGIEKKLKNVTNWKILILLWVKIGYNNNNNFPHNFEDPFWKELTSKSTVLSIL
jgi:hypothetical protein